MNNMLTLMEHYSEAMGYAEIATNSAGTALEKYESAYLTSAEAAQNRLTASFEEFAQTILSSATLIEGFSFLSELTVSATEATKKLGGLKGVIATLISVATILNIKKLGSGISGILINAKNGSSIIGNFSNAFKAMNVNIQAGQSKASVFIKTLISGFTGVSGAAATATAAISAITLLISGAIILWQKYKQSQEEVRQTAVEAAEAHNEMASAIDDYKSRYDELKNKLRDNNTTEQEAIQIKQELLTIQESLIEQYGEKAEGINLVTGRYKEQIEVLDNLTKAEYEYFLNRANPGTLKDISEEYSSYQKSGLNGEFLGFAAKFADKELDDYMSKIANDITSKYDNISFDVGTFSLTEDISIYEYKDILEDTAKSIREIRQEAVELYGEDSRRVKIIDNWSADVASELSDIDKKLQESEEAFNTYAIGTLQNSDKYSNAYGKMITAQKQYNDAIKEGNKDKAYEAYKNFESAYSEFGSIYDGIKNKGSADEAANVYVEEFYKAFTEAAEEYKVRVQIDEESISVEGSARKFAQDFGEQLKNEFSNENGKIDFDKLVNEYIKYKSIIGETYDSSDDTKLANAGLTEQVNLFKELDSLCTRYGVDINKLLPILSSLNIIQGEFAQNVEDSNNAVQSFSNTISGLKSAGESIEKLSKAYKELYEDGKVSFSTLADIQEKFGNVEGIEDYIITLAEADGNTQKTARVLDILLEESIKAKLGVDSLANANEDLVASLLEEAGVANASAKAAELIGEAKAKAKIATLDFADSATIGKDSIKSLATEFGVSTQKIYELMAAEIAFNNQTLDVSQKVAALQSLAAAAGVANAHMYPDLLEFYTNEAEQSGKYTTGEEVQAVAEAMLYKKLLSDIQNASKEPPTTEWTPPEDTNKKDPILDAWKEDVAEQKHLLEMDKQTKEQYYKWLRDNYKKRLTDTKKYSDELRSIEEELYNWEKEKIDENIASETAKLENDKLNGLISEKEYNQKLKQLYDDGYNDLQRATKEYQLYGVDNTERLEKENEYLEQYKENHIACYEAEHEELEHALDMNLISQEEYLQELQRLYAEYYQGNPMYAEQAKDIEKEIRDAYVGAYEERHKELDHALKMNLMTEEMYLIELYRLYQEYYAGNEAFADEAMAAEEELFEQMTSTIEKWAQAAADAVEAIADAASETVQAVTDLIHNSIDTHEENFNLEKKALDHALAMNYISEEEYYDSLESLYKTYFKDKNMYTEQYWENQEEVYKHEQDMLKESADAVEDIHAEVVDMIKDELEETIDAIDKAKDAYLDLIDIRREALNEQKDEDDYNEEREERINDISELQRQLNALANDTSAEGIRKYKEIQQQLRDAQKDLEELEEDHAYELMNKELDNEASATEKAYDNKKSELEALLDNNEYLVDEAWARLSDKNSNLYNELIEHNKKYSTSIKDDITDSWNTATKALQGYADAEAGYRGIVGEIGKTGMTDGDYQHSQNITDAKQAYNWVKVALEFAGSMLSVAGGLMGSMMSIAGVFLPQPFGSLVSIGGGMMGAFSGVGGAVLGALGSFASGTNYVPKTGVYETDEFGREELKFLKSPHNGRYTMLTEGSKVISGEGTERLWRLANNPNLFTGGGTNSVNVSNLKDIVSSIPVSNSQTSSISNTFYIKSSNPQDVAAEIEKLMPKIANYTIGNMVSGSNNNGVKRKIQHLY